MDLSAEQVAALTRSISPVRLGTYLTAAGGSESGALDLYLWDRRLSVAFSLTWPCWKSHCATR